MCIIPLEKKIAAKIRKNLQGKKKSRNFAVQKSGSGAKP